MGALVETNTNEHVRKAGAFTVMSRRTLRTLFRKDM